MDKDKKKILLIVMFVLLFLAGAIYVISSNQKNTETKDQEENVVDEVDNSESEIKVTPGEKLVWESERIEFDLPKGWVYEIETNDIYQEEVTITGDSIASMLSYIELAPGEEEKNWNDQENVVYENTRSVLFDRDGELKVVFNARTVITSFDYETEESSEATYGLFLTLTKDGSTISNLSDQEMALVKFMMDSYEENAL